MSEQFHINGQDYTRTEVLAYAREQQALAPEWESSHWKCVLDWFSDDETVWAKTSGTTGEPKPIALSKNAMMVSAKATADYLGLPKNASVLLALPSAFIGGKMMIVRALVNAWNLHWIAPSARLHAPAGVTIDLVALTPHQVESTLTSNPSFFHSIHACLVGGAAVSAALREKMEALPTLFYATYGMTETTSHIALQLLNGPTAENHFHTLPHVEVSLDARGCLVVHAPLLAAQALVTNDVAELVSNQTFRILGRIDHVINSGGLKIHPMELEKKLSQLIHVPFYIGPEASEKWGQQVVLHIEGETLSAEDEMQLLNECRLLLSPEEVPKRVHYHTIFARTETGKLIRT
jgi:O-succinylbenzoic acid--CoA ligase